jgi:hypothetical protein
MFSSAESEQIECLCTIYLGSLDRTEAIEAAKSLRTLSSQGRDLLSKWARPFGELVRAILTSAGSPASAAHLAGTLLSVTSPSLSSSRSGGTNPKKAHLELMVRLIKSVGFRSTYVLVDKVDETALTASNAEASFNLIRELLTDLELLQMQGIAFKFFLWDRMEPQYRILARPDRIQQFHLSWTTEQINQMLSRRLEAFSNGGVTELTQLAGHGTGQSLQYLVVLFANGSPRDMIRICQFMISEQLQIDSSAKQLSLRATIEGIAKF